MVSQRIPRAAPAAVLLAFSLVGCGAPQLSRPAPVPSGQAACQPPGGPLAEIELIDLRGDFTLVAFATAGRSPGGASEGLLSLSLDRGLRGRSTIDLLAIGVTEVSVSPNTALPALSGVEGGESIGERGVVLWMGRGSAIHGGARFHALGRAQDGRIVGTWEGDREQPRPVGYFCLSALRGS